MKSVEITGKVRALDVTKAELKATRKAEQVPCVLYGGEKPVHFSADLSSFKSLIYSPESYLVNLDIDGQKVLAVLQDSQYHPVNDSLLHVDFLQISENKPVVIEVPVKVTGTSPGVLAGGKLQVKLKKLKVKALPKNLPDNVVVDISGVLIGKSVKVEALDAKEFEFVTSGNAVVVAVRVTRASAQEEAAAKAAAAAPAAKGGAKAPAAAAKAPAAAAKAPAKK
jgi:large subunit ribosomal protein L25